MTVELIMVVGLVMTVGFYNANNHCRLGGFPTTVQSLLLLDFLDLLDVKTLCTHICSDLDTGLYAYLF